MFDKDLWAPLPQTMKEMISGGIFEELSERVREAMEAGTIDARDDRHLSWMPLRLDEQGWGNVLGRVDGVFYWLFEEQEDANERMAKSGEKPIPMTVALAAFESPKDTEKQPVGLAAVPRPDRLAAYIRSVVKGSPVRSRRGPATVTGRRKPLTHVMRQPLGATQSPREGAADRFPEARRPVPGQP